MRKVGFFSILTLLLVSIFGLTRADYQSDEQLQKSTPKKTMVDFEAELMRPIKVADSSAILLVGNVVFRHNQATITCDSAIRFGEKLMKCYGNVIVNKETTYIYGDSAEYSGISNVAKIFAPLIKMVDKDVTMYCYNLSFNTLTNVGSFFGNATISQQDNLMEARSGTYNTNTKVLTFKGNVQMENPDYRIITDSMTYHTETQITNFFTQAHIWSKDSNYLSAQRGIYYRNKNLYDFFNNSYICTKEQEIWADSMLYDAGKEEAQLTRNIQIFDSTHHTLLFGDLGHYWGKTSGAFMTQKPAMLIVDRRQVRDSVKLDSIYFKYDTLFVKSDTLFMFTVKYKDGIFIDSLEMSMTQGAMEQGAFEDSGMDSDMGIEDKTDESINDLEQSVAQDTTMQDTTVRVEKPLSKRELKRIARQERRAAKEAIRKTKQEIKAAERDAKQAERLEKRNLRLKKRNKQIPVDDVLPEHMRNDSVATEEIISVVEESAPKSDTIAADSMVRLFKAYFNVRTYRTDFQSRCDSLVGYFTDSTMRMFKDPVIWSGENQVNAERIDIFSKNNQLDKMIFDIDPMMIEQVNDSLYNQIAGKFMEAYFKNNDVKTLYVDGNAQTYYYLEEGDSTGMTEVVGFLVADCSKIRFDFDNNAIYEIVWIGNPVYSIFPMDKIPDTQPQTMKNFKWRGDERPKDKNDIFNRDIRPSRRTEAEAIEQPQFPITNAINRYKEQLLMTNRWQDRVPDAQPAEE